MSVIAKQSRMQQMTGVSTDIQFMPVCRTTTARCNRLSCIWCATGMLQQSPCCQQLLRMHLFSTITPIFCTLLRRPCVIACASAPVPCLLPQQPYRKKQ